MHALARCSQRGARSPPFARPIHSGAALPSRSRTPTHSQSRRNWSLALMPNKQFNASLTVHALRRCQAAKANNLRLLHLLPHNMNLCSARCYRPSSHCLIALALTTLCGTCILTSSLSHRTRATLHVQPITSSTLRCRFRFRVHPLLIHYRTT